MNIYTTRYHKSRGTSTDLMPSIMGAIDAILDSKETSDDIKSATPIKRMFQANLSANVQKILSNVPDDEITTTPDNNTQAREQKRVNRNSLVTRSQRIGDKLKSIHKSNESLDIISPNVQKMLSNLPDAELVLAMDEKKTNSCFLLCNKSDKIKPSDNNNFSDFSNNNNISKNNKSFLLHSKSASNGYDFIVSDGINVPNNNECLFNNKPLGSYLHTSATGIASRMPVGRKNMGKYLQIPSESTNSTLSSEVSRPVSLTSLGSCSSSGSSGLHQQGSAYLASAESLDSDVEPNGSQGSADSGIAETTAISPELRVLQEVLDTESVYVSDLRQVIQGYLEPWRNDPDCPLQPHLPYLFSNLKEIYEFNRSFLHHLNTANCDSIQTANAFLQNDSGFSVYTEYCTNYPRTMTILTELTRDENMAALFREKQMALNHALPLGSYLLKPVQRILKYHLLLQRLSKQCETPHKPTVDLALTTMTSVATHINTMKRKHEHAVRVQEIQAQLYGWTGSDLTALGELIAEGTFRVNGARGRRHVFLFDKLLLMAKSKQDGALAYKSHIMCSNLMLVEQVRGESLSFHILPFDNPRLQCTLRARNAQHKREWTLQIKRVILENYSAVIPNHARQLVMKLGQEPMEEMPEENVEKWSPMKQHSTPQYLERRSHVRKVRDFTKRRAASQDRSFPSLTNWRRKSDPSGILQYNTITLPKTKSPKNPKKTKECATIFYTDLSDSENCDIVNESNDSITSNGDSCSRTYDNIEENALENQNYVNGSTIAQVVSDLLMQNQEFHKLLHRQRRNLRDKESVSDVWSKQEERLPNKSDSLPRSFQLNSLTEKKEEDDEDVSYHTISESTTSLQEKQPDVENIHEIDASTQIDDDYPEHKIYRKSTIRFSLLQRFRAILTEEQKKSKQPSYKQGSKHMGAKIANPDYADPHKLFSNSLNSSRSNISVDNDKIDFDDYDLNKSDIDMTINENEVLKEIDKRLSENLRVEEALISQNLYKSSHKSISASLSQICTLENKTYKRCNSDILNSSQNSDSYYECLLEKSLNEDGRIQKSDSFKDSHIINEHVIQKPKVEIKRPIKAPPPIPTKPKYLNNDKNSINKNVNNNKCTNGNVLPNNMLNTNLNNKVIFNKKNIETCNSTINFNQNSKGWVKTIVDRFE